MIKKKYYYFNGHTLHINIRDRLTRQKITPDHIYINGKEITSYTSDATYNCIIAGVPSSFTLLVTKDGYYDHNRSWTFVALDTGDVTLTPESTGTFNVEVHWNPPTGTAYDLDAHMIILDALTGTLVSSPNHLYYGSGQDSSYPDYYYDADNNKLPKSVIKHDNIFYILNYDDDAGANWGGSESSRTKNNHTENLTGTLVTGNIYRFIIEDYPEEDHMNSIDCPNSIVTVTLDGVDTVYNLSSNNSDKYWIVCQIKEYEDEDHNKYWDIDNSVSGYTDSDPYNPSNLS